MNEELVPPPLHPEPEPEESPRRQGLFAVLVVSVVVLSGALVYVIGAIANAGGETEAAEADARAVIADVDIEVPDTLPFDQGPDTDDAVAQTTSTLPESDVDEIASTTSTTLLPEEGKHPGVEIDPSQIAIAFVSRVPGDEYGTVGYIDAEGTRFDTELRCERLDLNRSGGICLTSSGGLNATGQGLILEPTLVPTKTFGLVTPSRAAVSPNGDVIAWTGFTQGHDYAQPGEFATLTQLVSVSRSIGADLETAFLTFRGDQIFEPLDRNYWGVSFVDDDHFFATMQAEGQTNIVEGRISTAEIHVRFEDASCPEVSPDGGTVVVKEMRGELFQLVAIDVETGDRRDLGETRSVDDQVEFLDNDTILYGLVNPDEGTEAQPALDVWSLDLAPGSTPQLLIPFADSPAA